MTRDEWNAVLDTEPATPNQVGAVIAEFTRLGVDDRAERLAISAALLGLDDLGSTAHLVMGQAGRLVGILRQIKDRAGLPAVTVAVVECEPLVDDGQDQADEPGMTLAEAVKAVVLTFGAAAYGEESQPERRSANVRAYIGSTDVYTQGPKFGE